MLGFTNRGVFSVPVKGFLVFCHKVPFPIAFQRQDRQIAVNSNHHFKLICIWAGISGLANKKKWKMNPWIRYPHGVYCCFNYLMPGVDSSCLFSLSFYDASSTLLAFAQAFQLCSGHSSDLLTPLQLRQK